MIFACKLIRLSVLLLLTAGVALAQQGNPATLSIGELLREDGTVDLHRTFEGAVEINGFEVTMGGDGMLRARAEGDGQWLPGEQAPGTNGIVRALAWGPDGALYVGGSFTSAGGTPGTRGIARWVPTEDAFSTTGGVWSALGSDLNSAVYALAWGPDGALYAGGVFTSAGGVVGADRIARWTPDASGGTWSALGSGVNDSVYALAWGRDGALYAGGQFTSADGVVGADRIARWTPDGMDGGAWSALGSGVDGPVLAVTWGSDGALYVGGNFTSASGVSGLNNIARWTPNESGGTWSALGSGASDLVLALTWGQDGALYVGGQFTSAGNGVGTSRIARWTPDGATGGAWSALDSGVHTYGVSALAWGLENVLYVGGNFTTAGGMPSAFFARWASDTTSAEPNAPRAAPLAFEAAYPNPFNSRTTLVFSVAVPAEIHLAVYDVLGRRVAMLAEEPVGAGTHERVFDGAGLPNGTYLVRLSSGGTSQTRRVLLLR